MKLARIFMVAAIASIAVAAVADVADYSDFTGYVIRNGTSGAYTTSLSSDAVSETFDITAVGGGKVAIGTSAMNGLYVSDFTNFKFSNSVANVSGGQIVYPNMWVSDGTHYALLAVNDITGQTQSDDPVYNAMTSAGGLDSATFDDLGVRVYGTDYSDLDWLFSGCVRQSKFGGWTSALWKTSDAGTIDPVTMGDLGGLIFASPFSSNTVPGVSGNSQWSYVGTGDPQTTDSFFLMCGDTSASVENYDYTLGDFELQFVPEPASLSLLAMASLAIIRRRK